MLRARHHPGPLSVMGHSMLVISRVSCSSKSCVSQFIMILPLHSAATVIVSVSHRWYVSLSQNWILGELGAQCIQDFSRPLSNCVYLSLHIFAYFLPIFAEYCCYRKMCSSCAFVSSVSDGGRCRVWYFFISCSKSTTILGWRRLGSKCDRCGVVQDWARLRAC